MRNYRQIGGTRAPYLSGLGSGQSQGGKEGIINQPLLVRGYVPPKANTTHTVVAPNITYSYTLT